MKLRSYLILLVVAAVLPVMIFGGVMTYRSYQQERENLAQSMIGRARAISAALDREFLVSIQSLRVLSASTHLDKGQLSEFYAAMKGALAGYSRAWQNLTLTDASGQQLINLRRPFGSPLPATGNPDAIGRVRATKEPTIGNLSPGPVSGVSAVVVHVPILKDGQVKYTLNAIFYPAPLTDLLLQQKLPPGWIATTLDRNHVVVARTREFEKFFGKPVSSSFAARVKEHQEATGSDTSLDGMTVVTAHHRSDFSGWTIALAIPAAAAAAPLTRSLLLTGAGGLALLLGALGLAAILGRRIAGPVTALSQAAEKLGRRETPNASRSSILEVDRVAQAMDDAGRTRKEHEARIRQLNRVYAVLSDINQAIVRMRDPQILLSEACRIAVEKGEFTLAWIGRIKETGRIEAIAQAGFSDGYVEQLTIAPGEQQHDAAPMASALRGGQHEICNDIERDPRMAPWREEALRRGYRSFAAFPLKVGNEAVGVFNLYSSERGFFDAEELPLLDELAADIGLALEIHRNESDRLRTENALRDSEERFRQLAENIDEVFWLSTRDKSRMIYVSPGYEAIWGRSCHSLYDSPRDWLDAIHPDHREQVLRAALQEQETGVYDKEYRIVRPDGGVRWIRDRAFPVRDASGEVYRIAGIAEDITVRKEAEEALKRSHEQLEEKVAERTRDLVEANVKLQDLDRLKSQFLANMSHELRTPMNAIIGFTQLIHDGRVGGAVSAEQKEFLGDILTSATHLLQLINDVLDLSKVEAGRMEVLNSTFRVEDVIVEVVQNIAPIMSVKDLKLVRDIPPDLAPVTTDRRKLLQILLNLASNAAKFTDRGEITFRCQILPERMRLSVSDTGIGIKAEDLALLFQPFSQLEDGLRKRHEGTGLGLSLSKGLAALLGGDLTVVSEYGKGSTFTLHVPYSS
jgi:PAS domain S-box-containing protein